MNHPLTTNIVGYRTAFPDKKLLNNISNSFILNEISSLETISKHFFDDISCESESTINFKKAESILKSSEIILKSYYECTPAWCVRRKIFICILKSYKSKKLIEKTETMMEYVLALFHDEIKLLSNLLSNNYKSFVLWSHANWLLDVKKKFFNEKLFKIKYMTQILQLFCVMFESALSIDARNFHAWNMRKCFINQLLYLSQNTKNADFIKSFLVTCIQKLSQHTTAYTYNYNINNLEDSVNKLLCIYNLMYSNVLITNDFSNYSCWFLRQSILCQNDIENIIDYTQEKRIIREAISIEPNDETLYLYYSWWITYMLNLSFKRISLSTIIVKNRETSNSISQFRIYIFFDIPVQLVLSTLENCEDQNKSRYIFELRGISNSDSVSLLTNTNNTDHHEHCNKSLLTVNKDFPDHSNVWSITVTVNGISDSILLEPFLINLSIYSLNQINCEQCIEKISLLVTLLSNKSLNYEYTCIPLNYVTKHNYQYESYPDLPVHLITRYTEPIVLSIINDWFYLLDELFFFNTLLLQEHFQSTILRHFNFYCKHLPHDIHDFILETICKQSLSNVNNISTYIQYQLLNYIPEINQLTSKFKNDSIHISEILHRKNLPEMSISKNKLNFDIINDLTILSQYYPFLIDQRIQLLCNTQNILNSGMFLLMNLEEFNLAHHNIDNLILILHSYHTTFERNSELIQIDLSYNPLECRCQSCHDDMLYNYQHSIHFQHTVILELKDHFKKSNLPNKINITSTPLSSRFITAQNENNKILFDTCYILILYNVLIL